MSGQRRLVDKKLKEIYDSGNNAIYVQKHKDPAPTDPRNSNLYFGDDNFNAVSIDGWVLNRVGFLTPLRDVETIAIPGRDGLLTLDNGRWNTTTGKYQCFIQSGYADKKNDIQVWLSQIGFVRLEDTFDSNVYRMARFDGIDEVKVLDNDIARFDINFEFMPQKWLKEGETQISVGSSDKVRNPTQFDAKPIITVNGSGDGTLRIGSNTITLANITNGLTINSDFCRTYVGTTPMDDRMSGEYPTLPPGDTTIRWSGGITSVKIVPRWWTL